MASAKGNILNKTFELLKQGNISEGSVAAQKCYDEMPDNPTAVSIMAWALLENDRPIEALDLVDYAVKIGGPELAPRLYRGYLLLRMGIFDGALNDLNWVTKRKVENLGWAYLNIGRVYAGLGQYSEANQFLEKAIEVYGGSDTQSMKLRDWCRKATGQSDGFFGESISDDMLLLDEAEESIKFKEFWFAQWVAHKLLKLSRNRDFDTKAHLLELEALIGMFKLKNAREKAESIMSSLEDHPRFLSLYKRLVKLEKYQEEQENSYHQQQEQIHQQQFDEPIEEEHEEDFIEPVRQYIPQHPLRTDFVRFQHRTIKAVQIKVFDLVENVNTGKRKYLNELIESKTCYIGAEIIVINPYFRLQNATLKGIALWYLNNKTVGSTPFSVNTNKEWFTIVFIQSWGTETPGFWTQGQARIEILVDGNPVAEKWFFIGQREVPDLEEIPIPQIPVLDEEEEEEEEEIIPANFNKTKDSPAPKSEKKSSKFEVVGKEDIDKEKPEEPEESLEELLAKLDKFTGLNSVKQSMRDFVDYLKFIQERKKLGLKTSEGLSVNSVFLGNPGTGKTTVARLMGKIFKAMGILESGHLVEVDRSNLVGQYVGETAQKTDKVLEDAMGGLLFIDEAYTLVKTGGQDFGQEAIDTLLKKMEDKKGEFAVIAAGYPEEMKGFLESNPGMKSRFTHFFDFEDYTPDEMIEIFQLFAKSEEYIVSKETLDILKKEFTNLYRKRDKTFGNGRLVRNFIDDAKMQLSKRVLKLPPAQRTKEAMTTILPVDIEAFLKGEEMKKVKLGVDEENLARSLANLNKLTGLDSVKKEINELVKLARFYQEQGEDLQNKFTNHIVFLGNPGTGKTTVGRIVSEIFAALGILPKGHLVEVDRQALVSSYVGQTAERTKAVIDKSIGGTLFVDEAYTLTKKGDSGQDFGQEAVDTLLKRMEDDRGKFIVIAAGYTENMNTFLESNPGLKSRFTKYITFEDYNPENLMEITNRILKDKNHELEKDAVEPLMKYYSEIYRTRDKNFGNARIVRNIVDAALRQHLLRISDIPAAERTPDVIKYIKLQDILPVIATKKETKISRVEGDPEKLAQYLKELNILTGLDSVKRSVDKLLSGLKVAKLREARGLKVVQKNLHSVFLGNPGTGKTTVARLIANVYKEMGLIEKGHLVEVDRSALVAGYQGQTAAKTDEVIQRSMGGVLFIDEAYTLSRGANDFGQEAIDTLLKRMEDYQGQFVVIVAGYLNEMKTFIDSNPGLQSRFTNFFLFEDYTPREMLEIIAVMSEKNGYTLDEGALQMLLDKFKTLYANRDVNFGNARTVRNILFKAISNQEERILNIPDIKDEDLTTITIDDIEKINMSEFK